MKRIIVLSDTHGLLRAEVLEYLSQADVIIHGGDINAQAIVDKLREYAPLYIVRGNNDKEWAENLPRSLTFTIEGVRFFLVHSKKDVPPDLSNADVVRTHAAGRCMGPCFIKHKRGGRKFDLKNQREKSGGAGSLDLWDHNRPALFTANKTNQSHFIYRSTSKYCFAISIKSRT